MHTGLERMEESDSRRLLATDGGPFLCGAGPLADKDALYILRAMQHNSFENALDAVEHFLGHLELIDSTPSFQTAALWLDELVEQFTKLDTDRDGHVSREELDTWQQSSERNWVSCHFDALTRAGLLAAPDRVLTIAGVAKARDVFMGLALVQSRLPEVLRVANGAQVITPDILARFAAQHKVELSPTDYLVLRRLIEYLRYLHQKHLYAAERAIEEKLDRLTPEEIWPKSV